MQNRMLFAAFLLGTWLTIMPQYGQAAPKTGLDSITFMTEQYPPFNFKKDGILQGIAVDLLERMLQDAGASITKKDFQLLPWTRGYQTVLTQKNTCLFSTTRTKERERLFQWVGPIAQNKVVLTAKSDSAFRIKKTKDLQRYTYGVLKDDVGEQLLLEAGVPPSAIQRVNTSLQNIKKLDMGRIDLWSYGEPVARWQIKELGFDPKKFSSVYTLQTKELFFAFHPDTRPTILRSLQKQLDHLKTSGAYQQIVNKYVQ